jgi:hypothetical protein
MIYIHKVVFQTFKIYCISIYILFVLLWISTYNIVYQWTCRLFNTFLNMSKNVIWSAALSDYDLSF